MKYFSILQILFAQMVITFFVFSPFLIRLQEISIQSLSYLLLIGFVHQYIAVMLHLSGLKKLKTITVAILGYTEPLFAMVLAYTFMSETITIIPIIGGILIGASSILSIME